MGSAAEMPIFEGVGLVIDLVRLLVRRPRVGEAQSGVRVGRRRRWGIPMVCFIRDPDQSVLAALAAGYLDAARPGRVPHALYRCADDPVRDRSASDAMSLASIEDVTSVRDILFTLSRELASGRNSRYGRIRFRQFGLVYWLMDQSLSSDTEDPDRVLRRRLRERDLVVRPDERILTATTESVASVVAIPAWGRRLLALIPPLWFSLKVSGRLPVLGRSYRWFLRGQSNLAPQDPGTFLGFAERLTKDNYPKEVPEQVLRLLTNAFLEDLRRAYGRWPWRLGGARRMTYAVVLVDGITRVNGGYRLLKLINDVRNETGAFDPLLVISGSQKVPPYAVDPADPDPDVGVWDAVGAKRGYEAWCMRFSRDTRRRAPTAWYLPIRIPRTLAEPGTITAGATAAADDRRRYVLARQELAVVDDFTIERPPVWSRRWVPGIAVLALVAALLVVGFDYRKRHCGELPGRAGAQWLLTIGDECIGVSDGSHVFQPTNDRLAKVERTVHEKNLEAAAQHRKSKRPYITMIYVAALTSTTSDLVTARQRLEGVAIEQSRQLDLTGPTDPIVRVLIANGGASMARGPELANIIVGLAADDPSVVGVVGLDQSRDPTVQVIRAIGQAGLPMIGATLSADTLIAQSPLYFQVSPQNNREAEVAAQYAKDALSQHTRPGSTTWVAQHVRILYSADPTDTYSNDLEKDLVQQFQTAGFTVEPVKFNPLGRAQTSPSGPPIPGAASAADDACKQDGLVFFAGRQEDFQELLEGFDRSCRHDPPWIMGGDDAAKYVADEKKRNLFLEIPYNYVSFAVGSPCQNDQAYRNDDMYSSLARLFPDECSTGKYSSLDGSIELAYDAAHAMVISAKRLVQGSPTRITPGGLWYELSRLRLEGESGTVDFETNGTQYPPDKPVAVLDVKDGQPHFDGLCGQHPRYNQAAWCTGAGKQ